MDRAVGKAMDEFDGRLAVYEAEQGNAAAFCAQVNGNSCLIFHGKRSISGHG
jgi:hypothetical protein